MSRFLAWGAFFLFLLLQGGRASAGNEGAEARVVLLTMSPGSDSVSQFGHAELCIVSSTRRRGDCFNYGVPLDKAPSSWAIARGGLIYHVQREAFDRVDRHYQSQGRAVWAQVIPVPLEEIPALHKQLILDATPRESEYEYEPFTENCTTRVRDILDTALHGRLRLSAELPSALTYRADAAGAVRGSAFDATVMDLLLGSRGDETLTEWESLYLPRRLREHLASKLGLVPRLLPSADVALLRRKPRPEGQRGGAWVLACCIAFVALLLLGRLCARLIPSLIAIPLGVSGAALWYLIAFGTHEQAWPNYAILVLCPLDLVLITCVRGIGVWVLRYLEIRIFLCALVAASVIAEIVSQPIATEALTVGVVLFSALRAARRACSLPDKGPHQGDHLSAREPSTVK